MTDLVELLRSKATDCHESEEPLYLEAAAEIERLLELITAQAAELAALRFPGHDLANAELSEENDRLIAEIERLTEELRAVALYTELTRGTDR